MAHSHVFVGPGASAGRARAQFVTMVFAAIAAAGRIVANRFAVARLADLDDRMLEDIGLSRADLRMALSLPVWDDPSVRLARDARRGAKTR